MRRAGLAFIALVMGAGLAVWAGDRLLQLREMENWPTTMATVDQVDFAPDPDAPTGPSYPNIVYTYDVDGATYTSTRISLSGPEPVTEDDQSQWLAYYPPGEEVLVFYDPDSPEDAVLEREGPVPAYAALVLGGLVAIASLVALVAGLMDSYKRRIGHDEYGLA